MEVEIKKKGPLKTITKPVIARVVDIIQKETNKHINNRHGCPRLFEIKKKKLQLVELFVLREYKQCEWMITPKRGCKKHQMHIRGANDKFPDFFRMGTFIDSNLLRSNLLRLQCTCIVQTTSGRPHGSRLVWACQWPSSQPLSSPQLSHNDSLWA